MNRRFKIKKLLHAFFEYLFVAVLIVDCRSIWYHLDSTPRGKGMYLAIVLAVAVLGGILTNGKTKQATMRLAYLTVVILAVYLGIYEVITRSYSLRIVLGFAMVVLYYCICCRGQMVPSVLIKYKNIICIVACVSLFFWLFGSILNWIPASGSTYTTWTGGNWLKQIPNYYYIYYNTQSITRFGVTLARNTAIFTEAPMSSLHFTFALGIEFLLVNDRKIWRCIVLVLAVLSTTATTGYIFLALLFTAYLSLNREKKTVAARTVRIVILPIVVAAGGIVAYQLLTNKLSTGSGIERTSDFMTGFSAWRKKPIFGWGYNDNEIETGFSNSVTRLLYNGGIYLAAPYLYCFGAGVFSSARFHEKKKILFALLLLFVFIVTICCYQYLIIFIMCYLVDIGNRRHAESEIHHYSYAHMHSEMKGRGMSGG